jgi:hypothetical protein
VTDTWRKSTPGAKLRDGVAARAILSAVFPPATEAGAASIGTGRMECCMATIWPRPERLIPPRLVAALEAAQAGHTEKALQLLDDRDRDDALTRDAASVVRGLVALENGRSEAAGRLLRPLLRRADPALALHATLGLVELNVRKRRYTNAAALVERARRLPADDAMALALEATALRMQLLRHGQTAADRVAALPLQLRRQHPAAVHAAVHLLRAEAALLSGDFAAAVAAEEQASSWVRTAQRTLLAKQHESIRHLLDEAPFAEVEDWQLGRRSVSRAQVASLEEQDWQLWVDFLHLSLRWRESPDTPPVVVHFATATEAWAVLAALITAPHRRLTWARAAALIHADESATPQQVDTLRSWIHEHGGPDLIETTADGFRLRTERYVVLYPTREIPQTQQLLLGLLAEHPGARANELERLLDIPRRTLVRHLASLRATGFVRLIGGGRESCYALV